MVDGCRPQERLSCGSKRSGRGYKPRPAPGLADSLDFDLAEEKAGHVGPIASRNFDIENY